MSQHMAMESHGVTWSPQQWPWSQEKLLKS